MAFTKAWATNSMMGASPNSWNLAWAREGEKGAMCTPSQKKKAKAAHISTVSVSSKQPKQIALLFWQQRSYWHAKYLSYEYLRWSEPTVSSVTSCPGLKWEVCSSQSWQLDSTKDRHTPCTAKHDIPISRSTEKIYSLPDFFCNQSHVDCFSPIFTPLYSIILEISAWYKFVHVLTEFRALLTLRFLCH